MCTDLPTGLAGFPVHVKACWHVECSFWVIFCSIFCSLIWPQHAQTQKRLNVRVPNWRPRVLMRPQRLKPLPMFGYVELHYLNRGVLSVAFDGLVLKRLRFFMKQWSAFTAYWPSIFKRRQITEMCAPVCICSGVLLLLSYLYIYAHGSRILRPLIGHDLVLM